jgi:deazaflavin-dependent oxidoreductase (nitroreductase family)
MGKAGEIVTGIHARLIEVTGAFGGGSDDGSTLALNHVGAKSGTPRKSPVMFVRHDESYLIAASAAGSDHNPGWYYNLKANPNTVINVGRTDIPVTAREADPEERDDLYARISAVQPRFAGYEKKTDRVIPVFVLTPR